MNSDEYKKAPGFYRSSSTNLSAPDIGNFIRFDNIQPDALGDITLAYNVLTPSSGTTRQTGVNAIQLVLNAPNPGEPPLITQQPQFTVGPSNGFVVLTVQASGAGLSYQWRKDGTVLQNGGHVSGADTASLTIYPFTAADEGIYSVAVFSPAGSAISRNAALSISQYDIEDALAGYWNFDAGSGLIVSNSVSGGQPMGITNATGNPLWGAGQVNGSFNFDNFTYGFRQRLSESYEASFRISLGKSTEWECG